jgi:hypothetical protein
MVVVAPESLSTAQSVPLNLRSALYMQLHRTSAAGEELDMPAWGGDRKQQDWLSLP